MDKNKEKDTSMVSFSSPKGRAITVGSIAVGTVLFGYVMSNIHTLFPVIFQAPASYPYLDAFTTVMSFVATILMIYKKIESWMLWILVDIIGIVLYYVKEVKFVSILYVIFLALATKGLISWYQTWKAQK
jgi:nicotinamide mononucleotide transporter